MINCFPRFDNQCSILFIDLVLATSAQEKVQEK